MAAKKAGKAAKGYEWKNDWLLHEPEDWVMLVVALLGFAELMPNVDFGSPFRFAWPVIITAVFLYKFGKRKPRK
ncbi:MAG: hypothetical protein WC717_05415 [Candidatus Micrarchaeia archaeon]|jgi:hypothetical protein